jgi:hypothetical protein
VRDGREWENWSFRSTAHLSQDEQRAIRQRFEHAARERAAAFVERQRHTADRAGRIWNSARPANDVHAYLVSKGVCSHGLRVYKGGRFPAPHPCAEWNTLLGAIAAFERELILERAAEGRAKAVQRGVRFGRPAALDDAQAAALRAEAGSWQGSAEELAEKWGISRSTLYRTLGAS